MRESVAELLELPKAEFEAQKAKAVKDDRRNLLTHFEAKFSDDPTRLAAVRRLLA